MSVKSRRGIKQVRDPSSGASEISVVSETHDTVLPAFPSADDMQKYESIHPGFADRILTMAEKQQTHTAKMSEVSGERGFTLAKRAQWLAAFVSCLGFAAAAYGFYSGFGYAAAALGVVSILMIVGGLIANKEP